MDAMEIGHVARTRNATAATAAERAAQDSTILFAARSQRSSSSVEWNVWFRTDLGLKSLCVCGVRPVRAVFVRRRRCLCIEHTDIQHTTYNKI